MFDRRIPALIVWSIVAVLVTGCANSEKLTQQATQKCNEEKYAKAEKKFRKAIAKDETNAEAYYQFSLCMTERRNYDEALRLANLAIARGHEHARSHRVRLYYVLAQRAVARSVEKQALGYLDEALADDPSFDEARRYRAQVYLLLAKKVPGGTEAQVLHFIAKALTDDPTYVEARRYRSEVFLRLAKSASARGEHDLALTHCNNALDDDSTSSEARRYRSEVFLRLAKQAARDGQLRPALEYANNALADDHQYTEARLYRAQLYLALARQAVTREDYEAAFEHFALAVRDDASLEQQLNLERGELYARIFDYDNAIKYTMRARAVSAMVAQATYNLARYHAIKGETKAARRFLFEFYDELARDYDDARRRAQTDEDFYKIRAEGWFQRWLQGERRLQLSIRGARNLNEDFIDRMGPGRYDAYIVVSYDNGVILSTDIVFDNNNPSYRAYVIFDYEVRAPVTLSVFDEDANQDDYYGSLRLPRLDMAMGLFTGQVVGPWGKMRQGKVVYELVDSDRSPYATRSRPPEDPPLLTYLFNALDVRGVIAPPMTSAASIGGAGSPSIAVIGVKLFGCATLMALSMNLKSLIVMEVVRIIYALLVGNDISFERVGGHLTVGYILKRIGNKSLRMMHGVVQFAECAVQAFR